MNMHDTASLDGIRAPQTLENLGVTAWELEMLGRRKQHPCGRPTGLLRKKEVKVGGSSEWL